MWARRGPTTWKHVDEDWWLFRLANASVGAGQWSPDGREFTPLFCKNVPGLHPAVHVSDWDFCKRLGVAAVAFYDPVRDDHQVVVVDNQGAHRMPEAASDTPIYCTRLLWSHQRLCTISLTGTVRLFPLRSTTCTDGPHTFDVSWTGMVRTIMQSHGKIYLLTMGKTWSAIDLDALTMTGMRAPLRLPFDDQSVLCHCIQPMWKGIEQHRVLFLTSAPDKSVHLSEWRLHDRQGWTMERSVLVWWMPAVSTMRYAALSALGLWTVVVEMPRHVRVASGCWEQNRTETTWPWTLSSSSKVSWGAAGPSSLRPVALLSDDGRWWRHHVLHVPLAVYRA
ncbi:hypothetical protein EBZ80_19990 [bacterium]|nr:hypothetical protein [bacterium]